MSINDMENKARTYREILAEVKALQEQADALKAELIAAGAFTIRYTVYESSRVNTAQLKADGLYEQYSSKQTALRFSVQ